MANLKLIPRLTLFGLLSTTTLFAVAFALYAAFDRFAILLMVVILGSVAILGLGCRGHLFTKRYSMMCGMLASLTIVYLVSVIPAAWIVARLHTLDSRARPELVRAYQRIGGPGVECWIDAPPPIRATIMRAIALGMPSNAGIVEYPHGFGYTTNSASGGTAEVVLANFYRGGEPSRAPEPGLRPFRQWLTLLSRPGDG